LAFRLVEVIYDKHRSQTSLGERKNVSNVLDNSSSDLLFSETERRLGPSPRRLDLDERLFLLGCTWVAFQFRRAADELYLHLRLRNGSACLRNRRIECLPGIHTFAWK
jgi:hypothetical protein